jgi:hypothetical protein
VYAAYARLLDIVFTSADEPWSVTPSPVMQGPRKAIEKRLRAASGAQFDTAFAATAGIRMEARDIESQLMDAIDEEVQRKADLDQPRLTRHLSDIWVEGGFERVLKLGQLIKAIYGTAIYKGPTETEMTDYSYVSGRLAKYRRPMLDLDTLDLYSYVIDPYAARAGVRWARGEAHIEQMDAQGIRQLGYSLGWSDAVMERALSSGGSQDAGDTLSERALRDEEARVGEQGKVKPGYEVVEYWGRIAPEYESVLKGKAEYEEIEVDESAHEEDLACEAKLWVINGTFCPEAAYNPLRPVRRPFVLDPWEVVPGSPYGRGLGENLFGLHEGLQSAFRLFMDNKAMVGSPPVVIDATRIAPGYKITMEPYAIWGFDGKPSDVYDTVKIPDVTGSILELIEKLEDVADEDSGVNRYTSGDTSKSLNQTARGISILTSRSDQQIRGAIEGLDAAIEDIMTASYHWLRDAKMIPGAVLDYKVVAQGSKSLMAREQQIRQLTEFLSLAGKVMPPQTVVMILRKIYSYFGEDDTDELFPKMEDSLNGQPPGGNPLGVPTGAGGGGPVPGGGGGGVAAPVGQPAGPMPAAPAVLGSSPIPGAAGA